MFQKAIALHRNGQLAEAAALYRDMLAQNPINADALHLLGVIEIQSQNADAALTLFERALAIAPDHVDALFNRGLALQDLKRFEEASASYDRVLAIEPGYAEALYNRGNALNALRRLDEALESYDRALAVRPHYAEALNNRGVTLYDLKRFEDAVASYNGALAINPVYADALNNRGLALYDMKRFGEALENFNRALAIKPDYADALFNRGNALYQLQRCEEAALDIERLLLIGANRKYALGQLLHFRMQSCDWRDFQTLADAVSTGVGEGQRICKPFEFQAVSESPVDLQACSQIFAADIRPLARTPTPHAERANHAKIRLGYVSGEIRDSATSYLAAGLFEMHDRERFEIYAFDNGFDDGGPMRKRLNGAFREFVDISRHSDLAAAESIRQRQIDILVDLNGYFGLGRSGVFALRAAPVQVNYLGFPATSGADYMDYIVADSIVIPEADKHYYNEKIVYMPGSYQVNDRNRRVADKLCARAENGLPAQGFVFCCFNNTYKITPPIFDMWMRLLKRIEGSVLWLYGADVSAAKNLRAEAQTRGVAPERLVFAGRMELPEHLARHSLADLFLDTLPYNAHTTASDALWAGLPVLTCLGKTFPGRVAASLLTALGLPELVTRDLDAYETLAFELASNRQKLLSLRQRLAENRLTHPLFDTARFTKHIESAYHTMWERYRAGLAPADIYVQ